MDLQPLKQNWLQVSGQQPHKTLSGLVETCLSLAVKSEWFVQNDCEVIGVQTDLLN